LSQVLQLLADGLLGGKLFLVGAFALERVHFLALAGCWLRLCGQIGRLLGKETGGEDENHPKTQCGEKKSTTVERHCRQNSCEPLFYGSR
jgi:hypothetical protein